MSVSCQPRESGVIHRSIKQYINQHQFYLYLGLDILNSLMQTKHSKTELLHLTEKILLLYSSFLVGRYSHLEELFNDWFCFVYFILRALANAIFILQ